MKVPKRAYFDFAAATPVHKKAALAMAHGYSLVGNPGAIHSEGVAAAEALESARADIAKVFGVKSGTLIMTSGGTEANNMAILGFAQKLAAENRIQGAEFLFSCIEHPSVLACESELVRMGAVVKRIPVDDTGHIRTSTVEEMLTPTTVFISVGWANGEVGTLQPIRQIAHAAKAYSASIVVHSDAGQAPLYRATDLYSLGADLVTLDASKLYGPRGIGVLYTRADNLLVPRLFGGRQEKGLRPGSENVALAAGFAAALQEMAVIRAQESERLIKLRESLLHELATKVPQAAFNGRGETLPHILNISIPGVSTEYVTLALDHRGFALSTKSACREGEESYSHVVDTITHDRVRSSATLRISMGLGTTAAQCKKLVSTLADIVALNVV